MPLEPEEVCRQTFVAPGCWFVWLRKLRHHRASSPNVACEVHALSDS